MTIFTAESSGIEVEEDTTDTWVDGGESASVQEAPAEIINCGCGSAEEEGLMLQVSLFALCRGSVSACVVWSL